MAAECPDRQNVVGAVSDDADAQAVSHSIVVMSPTDGELVDPLSLMG